ncbi:MAG: hypothetical protein ABIN36_03905 [Ferruginibacter sp.]
MMIFSLCQATCKKTVSDCKGQLLTIVCARRNTNPFVDVMEKNMEMLVRLSVRE